MQVKEITEIVESNNYPSIDEQFAIQDAAKKRVANRKYRKVIKESFQNMASLSVREAKEIANDDDVSCAEALASKTYIKAIESPDASINKFITDITGDSKRDEENNTNSFTAMILAVTGGGEW